MLEPDLYPLLVGLLELERRARERAERANERLAAMQRLLEAALAQGLSSILGVPLLIDSELARSVVGHLGEQDETPQMVVRGPQHATAIVDPLPIEQVLTNLLTNALRYGRCERPILVDIEAHDGTLQISVRDFGPGIPRQRRHGLFHRFYQGRAGDHRSGMGLGLYTSRQIVEQHGGHIPAEFPRDGGTRLVVVLPVE